jgi:hypothetical protein
LTLVQLSLADLTIAAASAVEPAFVGAGVPKFGGVDPLGLRQINFDLMDQVLPGLNNVARHIRPFVLVTWAWRRARRLAEALGIDEVPIDDLRDYVDRIEVIYAWSQFLRNSDADLPGRQVLAPLLQSDQWFFGGDNWRKRRDVRSYSTAFTAPINYGPGLKTLGWVVPHQKHADVLIPTPASGPALDALEAQITDRLDHAAFSQFGEVTVTAKEAMGWSEGWALDRVTDAEKRVMAELLLGSQAPLPRKMGGALMLAAAAHAGTADVASVRRTMAGPPSNFVPAADLDGAFGAWRRIQVRQLFRLTLEALFYWTVLQIEGAPRSTEALVGAFLDQADRPERGTAREWLDAPEVVGSGPTALMDRIGQALDDPSQLSLASTIADGLSFCIAEAPEHGQPFERADRLPLYRARREAAAWGKAPTKSFVQHVLESWVLAQHVYWSVGRGLADARARGKTILRLKVVLEEGGWTLAPGASQGSAPAPTPDRLQTALNLATECGLLTAPGD